MIIRILEIVICSECAGKDHSYKECKSTTMKCVNCDGPHRTFAASGPIRKGIIQNRKREI